MDRRISKWLVVGLCVLAVGCNQKIEECNSLIGRLNQSSSAIQTYTSGLMGDPAKAERTFTQLASTTKDEAVKLARVSLTVEALVDFSKQYQTMLKQMVESAAVMGEAAGQMNELQHAVDSSREALSSAMSQLRDACTKTRKECEKVGETLNDMPQVSGVRPDEDAKKLDAYQKSVSDLQLTDPVVNEAVSQLKEQIVAFAAILRKVSDASSVVEKAAREMKTVADTEPALTESINDFCQGKN